MDMARSVMILFFHICVHDSSVWNPKSAGSSCEGMLVCFFAKEKNKERENMNSHTSTCFYEKPVLLMD